MKRFKEMLNDEFVQMIIIVAIVFSAVAVPLSPML